MVKMYVMRGSVVVEIRYASCLASAKLFRSLVQRSARGLTVLFSR